MTSPLHTTCGLGRSAEDADTVVVATAPGRVNLIGEHTDYTGGLALPIAVDLGTTVEGRRLGDRIRLTSDAEAGTVDLPAPRAPGAATRTTNGAPAWGAYADAVATGLAARGQGGGFDGSVRTTLPVGAGLSSSAALEVALALALGFEGTRGDLVALTRDAEEAAVGVPCGLLDQLSSVCGVEGHALLIDFEHLEVTPVPLPDGLEVVVMHSGEARTLAGSAYADRHRECADAARQVGPLRHASADDVGQLADPVLRRRARHVVAENERVLAMVEALRSDDLRAAGTLLSEGHRSLRVDFEVSTPTLNELVARLEATDGVFGARLTGGGFGGCVVAFTTPGTLAPGSGVWPVRARGGAQVIRRQASASEPVE